MTTDIETLCVLRVLPVFTGTASAVKKIFKIFNKYDSPIKDGMTQAHISDEKLQEISEFLAKQIGLYFPRDRWRDLERGIFAACGETGSTDIAEFIDHILSGLTQEYIELIARHLTVGETYFFRDKPVFKALEEEVLPEIIQSRLSAGSRFLRIWSAGCATGEEPYSIAILLRRVMPDIESWKINILATDINVKSLNKAKEGVYTDWSFRNAPDWLKKGYFTKTDERKTYRIKDAIKDNVVFSYLNLAEDAYPSLINNTNAMDIIICRNVLMYFMPQHAGNVADKLYRSLVNRGWLIVSATEVSHALFAQFAPVRFPDIIFYRKGAAREGAAREGAAREGVEKLPFAPQPFMPPARQMPTFTPIAPVMTPEEPPLFAAPSQAAPSQAAPAFAEQAPEQEEKPVSLCGEALRHYERGNYASAEEKLLECIAGENANIKALLLLARVYANEGKLDNALMWAEKAIAADKVNPAAYYLRAVIQQERSNDEAAVRSLKQALFLDQEFVPAYMTLGAILQRQGKKKESDKYFNNAAAALRKLPQDSVVPESDGMTAARLVEAMKNRI